MSTHELLSAFRTRFPACSAVAFADLSTGMVLAAAAPQGYKQEQLDRLCDAGTATLTGPEAREVADILVAGTATAITSALRLEASGWHVFLQANPPGQEALCILAGSGAPLDEIAREAARLLARILEEA